MDAADYDAILVPGGLGPMVDVQCNTEVQKAIVRTWTTGKLVTAVCHGPCALLGVDLGDGTPFVRGKKLTSFSTKEEYDYARQDVPYELEDALRAEGAEYSSASNWQPHVIVDGRLITSRTPPPRDRWRSSCVPPSSGAFRRELMRRGLKHSSVRFSFSGSKLGHSNEPYLCTPLEPSHDAIAVQDYCHSYCSLRQGR